MNILLFPSGSGVAKEIWDALKFEKNINIIGTDYDANTFSSFQFQVVTGAPFIKDEQRTLAFLKKLIYTHNIDGIFPAMDHVGLFLKRHEAELNTKIFTSPLETCEVCISKKKTYELFEQTPKVNPEFYPKFIKPECGYGSRNAYIVKNSEDFEFLSKIVENFLVTEYLPGDEYTVDCFTSLEKGLIFCEARTRSKTIQGMSVLTEHVHLPECRTIAENISSKLKFIGAWFFQLKRNSEGVLTILEIAPRVPGAMCLHRVMGINFPLLTIYEHMGQTIDSVLINSYTPVCHKYFENNYKTNLQYSTVYIDLDDTIIIKNQVNTKVIQFMYHAKNAQKRLVLVTRNPKPIEKLERYLISPKIFDAIYICNGSKTDHMMNPGDSIFIDDSFSERAHAYSRGYNVFSCDMVEVLL